MPDTLAMRPYSVPDHSDAGCLFGGWLARQRWCGYPKDAIRDIRVAAVKPLGRTTGSPHLVVLKAHTVDSPMRFTMAAMECRSDQTPLFRIGGRPFTDASQNPIC